MTEGFRVLGLKFVFNELVWLWVCGQFKRVILVVVFFV